MSEWTAEPALVICSAAIKMAAQAPQAFRIDNRKRSAKGGKTLRPGRETPWWNEPRARLRPHLRKYGNQVNLGRVLGLPRPRINAYVTGGGQMPAAERTLQLLAWLMAVRQGRRPSKSGNVTDKVTCYAESKESPE